MGLGSSLNQSGLLDILRKTVPHLGSKLSGWISKVRGADRFIPYLQLLCEYSKLLHILYPFNAECLARKHCSMYPFKNHRCRCGHLHVHVKALIDAGSASINSFFLTLSEVSLFHDNVCNKIINQQGKSNMGRMI